MTTRASLAPISSGGLDNSHCARGCGVSSTCSGDVCARLLPAAFAKLASATSGIAATINVSTLAHRRIADSSQKFDAHLDELHNSHDFGRNCVWCGDVTAIAARDAAHNSP